MQASRKFERGLSALAKKDQALYTIHAGGLGSAVAWASGGAFKTLVNRVTANGGLSGGLERVCHGLYRYPRVRYLADLLLYHAAARLRAGTFCYLSLEAVLSDAGVISQIPINLFDQLVAQAIHN